MKVELLDCTEFPEDVIATMAAVCYDGNSADANANHRRLKTLLSKGHLSTLRFAYATFGISGVSRVESHQHMRVAHAGILQRSQRYVIEKDITVIRPPSFINASSDAILTVQEAEMAAEQAYNKLLDCGVPKEDARYVLPQGITTQFVMTGNFQMWLQFLKARTSPNAQWEIRAVAQEIGRQLYSIAPTVFADYK